MAALGDIVRGDDPPAERAFRRALLDYIARIKQSDDTAMVLTPVRAARAFGGLPNGWRRVAKRAGFSDVTPHTLHHSFASVAADLG